MAPDGSEAYRVSGGRTKKATGQRIEESSFYDRFTSGFVKMLKAMVAATISELPGVGRGLRGSLSQFSDLVITDGTIMKLHDLPADTFPGVSTNHSPASLKMHAVISVTGKGKSSVKLTPGKNHDGPVFQVGSWVKEKLLLFDLGYYRYQLFSRIVQNGGFFVSRLKSNSDLEIIGENRVCPGPIKLVGHRILTISPVLKRQVLDVMVNVNSRKPGNSGRRRTDRNTLRVVGIRNNDARCYHFFITNIPPDKLTAEEAIDPNRNRGGLLAAVETGTHEYDRRRR